MSLLALIQKFGSLKNIPAAELAALGYRMKSENGVFHLRKVGTADPSSAILASLSSRYGIPAGAFETLSPEYLARFEKIATPDTLGTTADGPDGRRVCPRCAALTKRWVKYVHAWSTDTLDDFRAEDGAHRLTVERLEAAGIRVPIWLTGTDRWHLDVSSGTAISEVDRVRRLIGEMRTAFSEFLGEELVRPEACLNELASRLKTRPDQASVASAIVDEATLRLAVSVCMRRAMQSGALRETPHHSGLFHLQSVQERLSRREQHDAGTYTIGLSRKDPFKDLTLGNDSGCCVGIYLDKGGQFGEGHGAYTMPRCLTDAAAQFVELWSPSERVGMAMLFAGYDRDRAPTLIVNSIELSRKVEFAANTMSDAIHGWILEYGTAAGFKRFVVGATGYNTGTEYGRLADIDARPVTGISKFHALEHQPYSDVLTRGGSGDCGVERVIALEPTLFGTSGSFGQSSLSSDDWSIERLFEIIRRDVAIVISPSMVERRIGLRFSGRWERKAAENVLHEIRQLIRRVRNCGFGHPVEAACIISPHLNAEDVPLKGRLSRVRSKMKKVGDSRHWRIWFVTLGRPWDLGQSFSDLVDSNEPSGYEEVVSMLCLLDGVTAEHRPGCKLPRHWQTRVGHGHGSRFAVGSLDLEGDHYEFSANYKGERQLIKSIEIAGQ